MKDNSKAARDRRRREAETRQKSYDALTIEQKLARLDSFPGKSAKQRSLLTAQLDD